MRFLMPNSAKTVFFGGEFWSGKKKPLYSGEGLRC
jgi:hypothetical protein